MKDHDLRILAGRASTLRERFSGDYEPLAPLHTARAENRLARWMQCCAGSDQSLFNERLAQDGWEHADLRSTLGTVILSKNAPWPSWMPIFRSACEWMDNAAGVQQPEDRICLPFATAAWDAWQQTSATLPVHVQPPARAALREQLERRLQRWALPVARYEMTALHAAHQVGLARWMEKPERVQEAWLKRLQTEGLESFFLEWSALARHLAETSNLWLAASLELVSSAAADFSQLHSLWEMPPEDSTPVIERLDLDASDLHDGNRSVAVITFAGGCKAVYKPRDLQTEAHLSDFLMWLDQTWGSNRYQPLAILPREGYGWTAFIEHHPCTSESEQRHYAYRLGALLAVLERLQATDCHAENVIPSGEWPVLVDGEMLFSARAGAASLFPKEEVVLQSGVLPVWQCLPSGEERRIDSAWQVQAAHQPYLLQGYRETSAALSQLSPNRLAAPPFQLIKTGQVRNALHATGEYAVMIDRLCDPLMQREMVDASIELESLARSRLDRAQNAHGAMWIAEIRGLEKGDIPRFTTSPVMDGQASPVTCEQQMEGLVARSLTLPTAVLPTAVVPSLPTDQLFKSEAERMGVWLVEQAIPMGDNGFTWLRRQASGSLIGLQTLPADLYHGVTGVALFLSALAQVTGKSRFADVSLGATAPVRMALQTRQFGPLLHSIGLAGAGGTVYALARMADFLDQPPLLESALLLAEHACKQASTAGPLRNEVMDGNAGLLLALLALQRQTGLPWLARSVDILGRSLFMAASLHALPQGFAHGCTGIQYALAKLGIQAPPLVLEPWQDLENLSWCQGTAGKALAALSVASAADQEALRAGLHVMAQAENDAPVTVCCGLCGEIEVLLLAAQKLKEDRFRSAAEAKARRLLQQSMDIDEPGFYRGLAGLGYTLLRLHSPDRMPSVLDWA